MSSERKNKKTSPPPAGHTLSGECDVWDMTNRYGTYNVQNTNGIQNDFPQIGQGGESPPEKADKKAEPSPRQKKRK